jgi:aryl-alcohol dehydrogenase-like predicted oxidoreductase
MEYSKIEGVKNPVSRLIFGAAVQQMWRGEDASEVLDAAFNSGITTFDTARGYGGSEVSLGNWIEKRGNRNDINIITKGCMLTDSKTKITSKLISQEVSQSLSALKVDFIDIYFLHKDDKTSDVGPIIEKLNELHEKEIIGIFGASNWTSQRIEEAQEYAYKRGLKGFYVAQQCYSFLEQIEDPFDSVCLAGEKNKKEREWYIKNNMPVFAYSALARGFLSGKVKSKDNAEKVKEMFDKGFVMEYFHPQNMERLARLERMAEEKRITVPELALIYLLNTGVNVYPIMSPSAKHVESNVKAVGVRLTEEEYLWLDEGI